MSVKIIEPIKNYLKEFNTPEEFNNFYSVNKDALNELTTHKLNKMYHVKGYRITKIKNELMLKRWDDSPHEEPKFTPIDKFNAHEERISSLQKELEMSKSQLTEMKNENPNKQLQELKGEMQRYNMHINNIISLDSKVSKIESSINKYDTEINKYETEINNIKDDIKKIKGTITDMIKFINENLGS